MRKISLIGLAMLIVSIPTFAGDYLTNTNQNAAFLRMIARGASIDVDGVYSNPAGLAFLPKDGLQVALTIQSAYQTRDIAATSPLWTMDGQNTVRKYEGKASAPVIPSIHAVYKKGDWAFSGSFAIVGGGATEIKLSATLAEMRKFVLSQNYPGLNINEKRIILLDGSSRLLSTFSEKSSKEVTDYLKKHDVEIKLNQRVMGYENYQLALNDGTASNTKKNVFWVAGVKANSLQGLPTYGPGNRLKVDTYNRLSQYPNIFAIGNTALMISEEYPKGHPQVVQPAIQQARNLIRNLQRAEAGLPLQPFIYQNKGSMETIGRNHAVVELKKLRFGSFPVWAVWLFIHLMSIVGVKKRLSIFVDWMWSYFTYDLSLRIIIKPLKRQ